MELTQTQQQLLTPMETMETIVEKYKAAIKAEVDRQWSLCLSEIKALYTNVVRREAMTGLLNHTALETDLATMTGTVGVAFIDINGLKYTNDNFGHEAGDKLILNVAKLLKEGFSDCSVYRRSGDEFIIITTTEVTDFKRRLTLLHEGLWNTEYFDHPVMSLGWVIGDNVDNCLMEAEQHMYIDKHHFYNVYPKYDLRNERQRLLS